MKTDGFIDNFEGWCRECVRITDKLSGQEIPFVLNAPQRRVLQEMEGRRRAGLPIRVILLKARQWGGSTLVQVYMAWLQLVHRRGWNSVVCAHVKDAAASIRGMYSRLLRAYPDDMKDGDKADWQLTPYEKSRDICQIKARDCRVVLATASSPDAVRGGAYQMAHLSEVAFWGQPGMEGSGSNDDAARIVRTICGSIPLGPDTLVVMESTADGPQGYFYEEWQRAVRGESDKIPIFVPWHEIEIYSRSVKPSEVLKLTNSLDEYEKNLLSKGVALEKVAWYHYKRKEYTTHRQMMAEYPTTPDEAFAFSADPLLPTQYTAAIEEVTGEQHPDIEPLMTATYGKTLVSLWRRDRHIEMQSDLHNAESLRQILQSAAGLNVPLLLPEAVAEPESHAAWLARFADTEGVRTVYDTEGNNRFAMTQENLNMLVDHFTDLMQWAEQTGVTVADRDPDALTQMATLRAPTHNLLRMPRVLCRLALLCAADRALRECTVHSA